MNYEQQEIAENEVMVVQPEHGTCAYCLKTDKGWFPVDLVRGKRYLPSGALEYHCYEAYAWG